MNRISKILITFYAIFALGCAAVPALAGAEALVTPSTDLMLDGQWEGVVTIRNPASEDRKLRVRLTLENSHVKVDYENSEGAWKETMQGLFRISRQGSNAVIQATDSGISGTRWYETWVFIVSFHTKNKLRAEYARLVNNVELRASDTRKTFSYGGTGMLSRVMPKKSPEKGDAKKSIIEITAEASGNYNWRGQSLSPEQLEEALFAEIDINSISEARLLRGDAGEDAKRKFEFGSIVHAVDARAFFEREDGTFRELIYIDD